MVVNYSQCFQIMYKHVQFQIFFPTSQDKPSQHFDENNTAKTKNKNKTNKNKNKQTKHTTKQINKCKK